MRYTFDRVKGAGNIDNSKDKKIGTAAIVLLVIVAASLIPWGFASFLSFFAFDVPGSENELSTGLMVAPIWAYPVLAAGCIIGSLLLKRKKRLLPALIVIAVPLAAVILWAIFLGIFICLQPQ